MSDAREAAGEGAPLPGAHLILTVSLSLFLTGPHLTQVSVMQYGRINTVDVPWTMAQDKTQLLSLVDLMQQEGGPSRIGNCWNHKPDVEPVF